MIIFLKRNIDKKIALAVLIAVFLVAVLTIWLAYKNLEFDPFFSSTPALKDPLAPVSEDPSVSVFDLKVQGIKKFASKEEFENFLEKAESAEYFALGFEAREPAMVEDLTIGAPIALEEKAFVAERVSETTIQVPGIDEPDIVKTDGKRIYFSLRSAWPIWQESMIMGEGIGMPFPYQESKTKIINAFPPADLIEESEIDKSGDLLLFENTLVIFSEKNILGYRVSDPQKPEKKWEIELGEKNSIITSRLYDGKIYLVTKNLINRFNPCPIRPLIIEGKPIEIECQEIYHPILPLPVDVTFLAMVLDPISGEIEKKIPFVGSSGQSVVYMSEGGIYITYSYHQSIVDFFSRFLKEECQDFIPKWVLERLEKLEGYEISHQAKLFEMETILREYQDSLDQDERLKIQNELTNRMINYYGKEKRKLERSGILKIGLKDFEISAIGNVPGYPLNQFALDEYQENLRIAITVGERFNWRIGGGGSANDIYILDKNLEITGSVMDLGLTERIYSARFIQDKGYLVTFREIDPFYVLDLSNPQKPELKGELKIPGYSSYLHPISKDKILGIGKEDSRVKVSLFDVSNPRNPKEADKYILEEFWSEVLSTHHAFLLDRKHEIFFLPGSQGGYIFSYKNDKLSLTRAVSDISAKRAIYLDDYLYVIGDKKILVLDQTNWEKVKELKF